MNKLFRQAFYLVVMLINAGAAFRFVQYIDDQFKSPYIDFEQQAAAGLIAACLVPLFVYNRSASIRDRVLTLLQFGVLCVTAVFGFMAKSFVDKGLGLFLMWFVCADVATITLVYMVERLWRVNGPKPSKEDLETWQRHVSDMHIIEGALEIQIRRTGHLSGGAILQYMATERILGSMRTERQRIEHQLEALGIRPPPAFSDGVEADPGTLEGESLQ